MDLLLLFGTQFVLSLLATALILRWFASPWLAKQPPRSALMILLLPHTFRHLGLVFIVPAFVGSRLDSSFANGAAYGDLASGLLAILALVLLRADHKLAMPAVWIFNVVGAIDLVNALRQAETVPHLGVAWIIPTFVVPLLLVTHAMIFARLVNSASARQPSNARRHSQVAQ